MAVSLHPLEQIVNVQWEEGGAIFIAGSVNVNKNVLAGKIEDLDKHLVMSKLDVEEFFGGNGIVNAASYATVGTQLKPTFLLAGNDDGTIAAGAPQNQVGIIVVSEDGKTWTQAHKIVEGRGDWQNFAAVVELVWHKQSRAFYAGVYTEQRYVFAYDIEGHEIIRGKRYNSLYTSSNGHSWSMVGEQEITGTDPASPLIPYYNPHTNLPDGVSSYWEKLDDKGKITESVVVIPSNPPIPDYYFGFVGLNPEHQEPAAITAKHFDGEITKNIPLRPGHIGCYAGGVYTIVSGGEIFASNDNAKTWYSAGSIDPFNFNAMCGGATKDQSDEEGTDG